MKTLVVDFPALRAAIAHMAEFEREIGECLDDIDQTVAGLRASWHGDGSDAQAQAQQQWEDGAAQMAAALSALRQIADTAHRNYADTVSRNGRMWQG
ncbi:WXG100 family type VII secretion target [Mycobacterium sp. Y57]|uniref:WXG100 family type VII secretion target n=1 Tax=Mycolicibacterium xanthum TaxID=2796469 RepID=UPI001C84CAB7|nr:WXG100 family type VII secretion target [Mycolicibacterium xanthum]MBX7431056.1 WXG100 family type VII secretion target [Mycolicibacterium xanthum]